MSTYYQDANTTILHGDCIETMRGMPENSVDSIVTDPPYGLGFMGKKWDDLPPGKEWAEQCLRVLKPGGHLIAFGGSRTWHRLAVAIEDAGFEIRDGVLWLYGSGFPKSHDISKAIDKMAGAEREVVGTARRSQNRSEGWDRPWMREQMESLGGSGMAEHAITAPATAEAQQWSGWGTALKPAYEPAVMARKPFTGTVARNVLEHGTGAINIDASRIGLGSEAPPTGSGNNLGYHGGGSGTGGNETPASGRFPANLILDEHTAELLDEQTEGTRAAKPSGGHVRHNTGTGTDTIQLGLKAVNTAGYDDPAGGASRFFYVAKAPKKERPVVDGVAHATVKPLKLMRYLVRMVTPPGGTILEPFAGSGTTIEAALVEGFNVIGIERETEYLPLIQHRINRANGGKP